jgi:formylglycine-generating enzyme required for sulfatase activity
MPDSTNRSLKVFLCHASADKPVVRKLYRYLRSKGMDPWLDSEKLLPGENWKIEISKALFESDVIVVCLSKNSVTKEGYVQSEIAFALDKALEKPAGTIFIIPAKLEECNVPTRLSPYQWVDLYRDGYKRLMLSLNKRALQLGLAIEPITISTKLEHGKIKRDTPEEIVAIVDREIIEQALNENTEPFATKKVLPEAEGTSIEEKPKIEEQISDETHVEQKGTSSEPVVEKDDIDFFQHFPLPESVEEQEEEKQITPIESSPEVFSSNELLPQKTDRVQNEVVLPSDLPEKRRLISNPKLRLFIGVASVIIFVPLCIMIGINYSINNLFEFVTFTPSPTNVVAITLTSQPTITDTPLATETSIPATSAFGIGSTMKGQDGMILLYVPAGEFMMGIRAEDLFDMCQKNHVDCELGWFEDGSPPHVVSLAAFWIDQTEVTNGQYEFCVSERVCSPPSITSSPKRSKYYGLPGFENFPVIFVDWHMANTYCEWAGRRLPTEAEWEKAARGTDSKIYPWGNDAPNDTLLNYNNYWMDTSVVRQYPAGKSPYGAYDMAGNVWEWTSSLDWPYPYIETDGRENLSAEGRRVLRGGSWYYLSTSVRAGFVPAGQSADIRVLSEIRGSSLPTDAGGVPWSFGTVGFRCAMSASP